MSKRSKNVSKNLILSVASRLFYLLLGFITRKLIIQFVAIEYLGLTSLYSNMLDFLNLAELGLGVAIQVRMYAPLVEKDNNKIYNIIQVAQKIYSIIGLIVLIFGGLSSLLLQFLIKDNPFPLWYVRLAYLISVAGISFSYFCASKRLYFESNEKYYIILSTDLVVRVITTVLGLVVLYLTKEYLYYAGLVAIQSTISNFYLSAHFRLTCKELRNQVKDKTFQKAEISVVGKSLKDVVPMKLGVYVFSSTDSIIITAFIGLSASAIYANYNLISISLLSISSMISNALVSTFGKLEKENIDRSALLGKYKVYENMQYMFSLFTAVCLILLYDKFMIAWVGGEYLIEKLCVLLLSLDYLIHSSFQPLSTLYTSTGKFKEDKVCSLLAAGMNIGLSLLLVNFIGIIGVIVGTLVSNIFTFIVRNYVINKKYFGRNNVSVIVKPLCVMVIYVVEVVICYFAIKFIHLNNKWLDFIVPAIICAVITNLFNLLIIMKLGYFKLLLSRMKRGKRDGDGIDQEAATPDL